MTPLALILATGLALAFWNHAAKLERRCRIQAATNAGLREELHRALDELREEREAMRELARETDAYRREDARREWVN